MTSLRFARLLLVGPTTAQPAATAAPVACPACLGPIDQTSGRLSSRLRCASCGRRFEMVAGIADLRLAYPDPQLTRAEDAEIAARLHGRAAELDLQELLAEHWRLVAKQPRLAARFTAGELVAREKVEPVVRAVEQNRKAPIGSTDRVLEVGCGTAALAAACARRGASVVATDLSLRWLVLAQKRLAEEPGHDVKLIGCAAEALPFADESFDLVLAADVIEHVDDPARFAAQAARVLRPGGLLFLATPNRFSLGLEPHVRLWGVGYLPRTLAERYVRAVRRSSYSHVRLLSAWTLGRLLQDQGLSVTIESPAISEEAQRVYAGPELRLIRIYNSVRELRPTRPLLRAVGPFFHVFARKAGS
jgi:2-polyprenyl-3-methyl-5-hydroxy-6-metoxy-1,4-benzoquinol methylase